MGHFHRSCIVAHDFDDFGQNVTFFPRFTIYLTVNDPKKPTYRGHRDCWPKRHVFSPIYLLFNSKTVKKAYNRAIRENVTFFPRFTFYLTEKWQKKPRIGAGQGRVAGPVGARAKRARSWLSQKLLSKRHVFSSILTQTAF